MKQRFNELFRLAIGIALGVLITRLLSASKVASPLKKTAPKVRPTSAAAVGPVLGDASLPPSLTQGGPRVAFMFMTEGLIVHQQVWDDWFKGHDGKYNLYVHAKPAGIAEEFRGLSPLFRSHVVPSVTTEYYKNLLHGMMQVLLYAHADPRNTHFVLLPHDAIPVKPLSYVYKTLSTDPLSRFCLTSAEQAQYGWNEFKQSKANKAFLPPLEHQYKSEMWSSISRQHVTALLADMQSILDVGREYGRNVVNGGAPDEMVLPTILHKLLGIKAFNTCHGAFDDKLKHHSGCCPMYTYWNDFNKDTPQIKYAPLFATLGARDGRPTLFTGIAKEPLKELIMEPGFMFLRKVLPGAFIREDDGSKDGKRIPLELSLNKLLKEMEKKLMPPEDE